MRTRITPNTKHFLRSLTQFCLDKCLGEHNMLRDLHENTNHLQWDSALETAAQKYADHLKNENHKLEPGHDPENENKKWGENLFWMSSSYRKGVCADALHSW